MESDEKKDSLKTLFQVLIYGATDVNTCVRKTLSQLMTSSVQQYYSGAGRIIRGVSKLNFSATNTYLYLLG